MLTRRQFVHRVSSGLFLAGGMSFLAHSASPLTPIRRPFSAGPLAGPSLPFDLRIPPPAPPSTTTPTTTPTPAADLRSPFTATEERREQPTDAHPGRALLAIIFVDIVGSTPRAVALGDAVWVEELDRYFTIVAFEARRWRVESVKTMGDGLFAICDSVTHAYYFAKAMRKRATAEMRLAIRAGIHAGDVIRVEEDAWHDRDVHGPTVIFASRIAELADHDEIVVSASANDSLRSAGILLASRGEHELKGFELKYQLFSDSGTG